MKGVAILILIFCISCNNKQIHNQIVSDSVQSELLGKWGAPNEAPFWNITNDSICYLDTSSEYRGWHSYKIINNDFVIYLPDHTGVLRNIHVIKDTMFFFEDDNYGAVVKGYRK